MQGRDKDKYQARVWDWLGTEKASTPRTLLTVQVPSFIHSRKLDVSIGEEEVRSYELDQTISGSVRLSEFGT